MPQLFTLNVSLFTPARHRVILVCLGILSFILYLVITKISAQFNWGEGYAARPIATYVILYLALFIVYALAVRMVWEKRSPRGFLWIILLFGLLFRAAILPSQQIQEDDIYRYLWDGKVFAHGINPYEYAPNLVDEFKDLRIEDPIKFKARFDERNIRELTLLNQLKWENDPAYITLERVNHPTIPTIYPPLAQYVFRLVHHIQPDSILTMRLAFLVFDLAALTFIILILGFFGKNRDLCLIYFWSPLLIKETFNSTHLDIIGVSMLCASVYFLVRSRHTLATFFLALGVLGKLYPIVLFPLYLKEMVSKQEVSSSARWLNPLLNTLLFLGVIGLFYFPFIQPKVAAFEGLKAFTTYWQSNDSIFALLVYFYRGFLGLIGVAGNLDFGDEEILFAYDLPTLFSKVTVMLVVVGAVLYFTFRRGGRPEPFSCVRQIFIILALVFLLSPVQNPWYLIWLLPFLCLLPSRAWILLTGLIGLYYLEFYFDYQELRQYLPWLPWFEYAPFYLLLALEILKKKPPPAPIQN